MPDAHGGVGHRAAASCLTESGANGVSAPRCGAKTRRGTSCVRPALENGRCPNHGGLSTGPRTKAGRKRIAAAQRKRWAAWRANHA